MVPVAVQAGFAQGDYLRLLHQAKHRVPVAIGCLGTAIRLNANRRLDAFKTPGKLKAVLAGGGRGTDRHHCPDPRLGSSLDNRITLPVELLVVQVQVGVKK